MTCIPFIQRSFWLHSFTCTSMPPFFFSFLLFFSFLFSLSLFFFFPSPLVAVFCVLCVCIAWLDSRHLAVLPIGRGSQTALYNTHHTLEMQPIEAHALLYNIRNCCLCCCCCCCCSFLLTPDLLHKAQLGGGGVLWRLRRCAHPTCCCCCQGDCQDGVGRLDDRGVVWSGVFFCLDPYSGLLLLVVVVLF